MAGKVIAALMARGSALAASPINLVSGERSGFSHGAPTLRRLKRGDSVNVEYGATARRYTATIGRQFSLGPPGARLMAVYDVVRDVPVPAIPEPPVDPSCRFRAAPHLL